MPRRTGRWSCIRVGQAERKSWGSTQHFECIRIGDEFNAHVSMSRDLNCICASSSCPFRSMSRVTNRRASRFWLGVHGRTFDRVVPCKSWIVEHRAADNCVWNRWCFDMVHMTYKCMSRVSRVPWKVETDSILCPPLTC